MSFSINDLFALRRGRRSEEGDFLSGKFLGEGVSDHPDEGLRIEDPLREEERRVVLDRYDALGDRPFGTGLDRLTRLAHQTFSAESAVMTLITPERQRIMSYAGEKVLEEVDRNASFCRYVVDENTLCVIEDARTDARFDGSPLVYGDPGIRFYAGAPLRTFDGHVLGAFCLVDRSADSFSEADRKSLRDFAQLAMDEIEKHRPLANVNGAVYHKNALLSSVVEVREKEDNVPLMSEATMDVVVRHAHTLTGADGMRLMQVDGDELICRATSGDTPMAATRSPAEGSLCMQSLKTNQLVYCKDLLTGAPAWADEQGLAAYREMEARSVVAVPLHVEERFAGALEVIKGEPHGFEEEEVQALKLLVGPVEEAIGRVLFKKAFQENKRRYRALIEQTGEAIAFFDPESGHVLEANSAFYSLIGYDREESEAHEGAGEEEELPDFTIYDLSTRDREAVDRDKERILEGQVVTAENRWNGWDDRIIDVQVSLSVIFQEGREVIGVVAHDISEQRRAEKALQQSADRNRTMLEHLPVGIYRSTPEGEIVEANEAMVRLLGAGSREELDQVDIADLYLNERDRRRHVRQLSTHGTHAAEFPIRRLNGEVIWVRDLPRAVTGEDGREIAYFDGAMVDVTVRKRAEKLRAESESRLREITENATDMIEIVDAGGIVQYVSGAVEEITGFQPSEIRGRYAFKHCHPDDLPKIEETYQQLVQEPGTTAEFEYRYRHGGEGAWRSLSVRARNLIGRAGINGILGIVRDITDRKKFQDQLVEAKEEAEEMARLKSSFLANMSHEIRTPLTGILGFADVLAGEIDDERREFVELIQQGGKRLSETLNSVLDLARLEAGGLELDLELIVIQEAVREAVQLLESVADEKGLDLRLDLPADELAVRTDETGLGRVLANLLSNAIKFTEEGSVTVRVCGSDENVQVHIADTGIGMGEAFQEEVFDEFKQESTGLSRSHTGTGLGLTITKRLVDMMGATIDLESTKGEGTTFTITFPRARSFPETTAPDESSPPRAKGGHLLVVEDTRETQRLIRHLLQANWEIKTVADGKAALDTAAATRYDAVLMDIKLEGDLDGTEVLERLREDARYAHVPVIALTAYAMPEQRQRIMNVGFDDYLTKPFTQEELHGVLGEALRTS